MSTLKSALRPPDPPSPPKPKKSMTKRALKFMKRKMGMDSSDSSPSPPKKSIAKRATRFFKKKMGMEYSPSTPSSSPSPSPPTRRVHFHENMDDNNIKQNPYRLRGKRPTKYGPDETSYLTEEEMKMCYGPLNPNRELDEFVQKIYDAEFGKLYRELKSARKSRMDVIREIFSIIGTADEFFDRYQDAIDLKAEDEMNNKKQELKDKEEREWLEKINKEHEDIEKKVCYFIHGYCICSVITFGVFMAMHFKLLGGRSRRQRMRKTQKRR